VGVAEVGVAVVLSALEALTMVKLVKVARLAVLVVVLDAAAEYETSEDELAVVKAVVTDAESGGERLTG
jgi:energy-converting hydrogenase Eha subunit C